MCYYNGVKVTKTEKIRLKHLEKLVTQYDFLDNPLYIGPNYPTAPLFKRIPGDQDFDIIKEEWGFLPPNIETDQQAWNFRHDHKDDQGTTVKGFMTLNAKVENLFTNDKGNPSLFRFAAMERRCLIPSTGFFEWRYVYHVSKSGKLFKTPVKYPYHIRLKDQEVWYFAGIWNPGIRRNTWSIVTTSPNKDHIMSQVHNSKKRMATILTEDLAWDWIFGKLSQNDVQDIGRFQFESNLMEAYPVAKGFLTAPDPTLPFHYPGLPPLGQDIFNYGQSELPF
jgi:putative SOS response-associated peptidase YedK